jgi:hypothetical protein
VLPNFLIIGAPRSGTTTLYASLLQHPDVFLSRPKEPMFFILEGGPERYPGPRSPAGARSLEEYQALFRGAELKKAVGEASPCYLFSPMAPYRIQHHIPDSKFIAILRNPVDRAYSHFIFHRMYGAEPLADFEKAVSAEEERKRKGWFFLWAYRGMSLYGEQIERYFSIFQKRQFRFYLFEDLVSDPHGLLADIFRFLGVDDRVRIHLPERNNPSGIPRHRSIHDFFSRPNFLKTQLKKIIPERVQFLLLARFFRWSYVEKPALTEDIRGRMLEMFREDILRTQDLIQRDLSAWLEAGKDRPQ